MTDYFEAYGSRMREYDRLFTELAKDLNTKGVKTVTSREEYPSSGLNNFVIAKTLKGRFVIGFSEVPYRFYISRDIDKNLGRGSSGTVKEVCGTDFPWTVDELLEVVQ